MANDLARVAEEEGARLTFELSRAFVEGAVHRNDDVVAELRRRGHAVAVHADVGGEPLMLEALEAELRRRRLRLEQLGGAITHISGICSEGPWVEAAVGAGYLSATGFVEFCLKSLDVLPAGFEHVATCDTPRDCHGAPLLDLERKMRPWRAGSAANWLTPDPRGQLVMIAGDSATPLQCLAEPALRDCKLDEDDAAAFAALIDDYLAARQSPDLAVCTVSWSIGTLPPDGFARSLFAAVAPYVTAGDVAWRTLPEMAAALP